MKKNERKTKLLVASLILGVGMTGNPASALAQEGSLSFSTLSNWYFIFSSGVGGWGTSLVMNEDGSFTGCYYDSEMGEMAEAYPYGSYYLCDFTGSFSEPVMVNEYTYSVTLTNLEYAVAVGTEEIVDGLRYVYSDALGIYGGEEFLIYLPDAPLSELPEEYLSWTTGSSLTGEETLGYYGIYNVAEEDGFTSFFTGSELDSLEALAAEYEEMLYAAETQTEMNSIAELLFYLWDDELNDIWSRLKETLDADAMSALTTEEIQWINEKEALVEAAGAEYEGGSMEIMVEYLAAAELTRERVYVLWELL